MKSNTKQGRDEFVLVLSPNHRAARWARKAVERRFAKSLAAPVLADLVTVVSELVNNSVQHGPGRPITITLVPTGGSIRGEVADQGNPSVSIPQIREAHESGLPVGLEDGGLGLALVDKLTSEWAVYEGSTHVWFELPLEE